MHIYPKCNCLINWCIGYKQVFKQLKMFTFAWESKKILSSCKAQSVPRAHEAKVAIKVKKVPLGHTWVYIYLYIPPDLVILVFDQGIYFYTSSPKGSDKHFIFMQGTDGAKGARGESGHKGEKGAPGPHVSRTCHIQGPYCLTIATLQRLLIICFFSLGCFWYPWTYWLTGHQRGEGKKRVKEM